MGVGSTKVSHTPAWGLWALSSAGDTPQKAPWWVLPSNRAKHSLGPTVGPWSFVQGQSRAKDKGRRLERDPATMAPLLPSPTAPCIENTSAQMGDPLTGKKTVSAHFLKMTRLRSRGPNAFAIRIPGQWSWEALFPHQPAFPLLLPAPLTFLVP